MVNKKGIIRIIEASFAILIIFSVILYSFERKAAVSDKTISDLVSSTLEEAAKNTILRTEIINEDSKKAENALRDFAGIRVNNPRLGYDVRICDYQNVCPLDKYPEDAKGNIYSGERIISASLGSEITQIKKIKMFVWERG